MAKHLRFAFLAIVFVIIGGVIIWYSLRSYEINTFSAQSSHMSNLLISAEFTTDNQTLLNWQNAVERDNPIMLAWFYKPPNDGDVLKIADNFDTFILTKRDEPTRDELRMMGKGPFLQYIRFDAVHDPCRQILNEVGSACSCDQSTNANNVAWQDGDICIIRDEHPDWVLRDTDGKPVIYKDYAYMDPGAVGWREFWLERAKNMQEDGWDGVFLDNLDATASRHTREGVTLANYDTDEAFRAAFEGFLEFIVQQYFEPAGRPVYANVTEFKDYQSISPFITLLDGAMNEAWSTGWNDSWRGIDEWEADLQFAENIQEQGKHLILVSQGDLNNVQRQAFAFTSYLLVANGKASFRYANSDDYDNPNIYMNYQLDLGSPLGERYEVGSGWQRDFTKGTVFVDPHNLSTVITQKPSMYILERSLNGGENYEILSVISPSATTYVDTNPQNNNSCYRLSYQVDGTTFYSNAVCVSE